MMTSVVNSIVWMANDFNIGNLVQNNLCVKRVNIERDFDFRINDYLDFNIVFLGFSP